MTGPLETDEMLLRACFHEAGHLVTAVTLGLQVDRAMVWFDEACGQWIGETMNAPIAVDAANFDDRAVRAYAGPIAERVCTTGRHVKRPHYLELAYTFGGRADFEAVRHWARALGLRGYSTRVTRRAVEIVRDEWSVVILVAERLKELHEATAQDVCDIVEDLQARSSPRRPAAREGGAHAPVAR